MSNKHWLVIAHRAGARIFCRGAEPHSLEPVARFEHPAAHLHEREFGSDRPGRMQNDARQGRHAMTNETPAREATAQTFAKEIAAYLEAARVDHHVTQLALVAEPHMLGLLRAALSKESAGLVSAELEKDLVHVSDDALVSYLANARFWI